MVKIVKFDPKLPTLEGGSMHSKKKGLTQEQLDDAVRKAAAPSAVEEMVEETLTKQVYSLSDGSLLTIVKATGATSVRRGKR